MGAFEAVVGAAAREAPTFPLLVGVDDRGGVDRDGVARDGDVGLHPSGGFGFGARAEDEVGAHFVERVAGGEAEGFLPGAASVEEAAEGLGRGRGGEGVEDCGAAGGSWIRVAEGERGRGVGAVAGGADPDPSAGLGGGELGGDVAGGGNFDAAEFRPSVVAGAVDFEGEGDGRGRIVGEVE